MIKDTVLENLSREELVITPKQIEVLYWVSQGLSNKQIAVEMGIAYGTVKNHINDIVNRINLPKGNFSTRTRLVIWAIQQGLLFGV